MTLLNFNTGEPTFRASPTGTTIEQKACSMRFFFLLPLLFVLQSHAQTSTFNSGNEGWKAFGDATSPDAVWVSTGGNPGGYIQVTDQSTGGTWHFVAPAKFLGNKCDAYDAFLRYDQITNDTTDEDLYGNRPDVVLFGAGLVLVFENDENPNLEWTHYDVHLRENAGWRLNSITGPVPTEAQFRTVLADLDELRIRGEYRPLEDVGGLDNVVLESSFGFDLDGDNSSGAAGGDFRQDTLCVSFGSVTDTDAVLFSQKPVDSIVVSISGGAAGEWLEAGAVPGTLTVQSPTPQTIVLINTGNATTFDFLQALLSIQYNDASTPPLRGLRSVTFRVFNECGEAATQSAVLPVFPKPDAGLDGDTLVCKGSAPFDLFGVLQGQPQPGGRWSPAPLSGNGLFDPGRDAGGKYAYVFPDAGECAGDTAFVEISIEEGFKLRPDTVICFGDTLLLRIPDGLLAWEWSTGSQRPELAVTEAGTYRLTGQTDICTATDSVLVDFYTCEICRHYVPNVFSPNDDGENDTWQVFLPCNWLDFRLEVFDRWGGLVFRADDPERNWDGFARGREPVPGVYVWRMTWTGELFGVPQVFQAEGDVTVVR